MSPSAATRVEWARRLAQALVAHGYLHDTVVGPVLEESTATGVSFSALLISRGFVSSEVAVGMLSQLTQLPAVDLSVDRPAASAVDLVPPVIGREYGALAFRLDGDQLLVAFGEPPDADDLRTLSAMLGYVVVPLLADPYAIERELDALAPVAQAAAAVAAPVAAAEVGADLNRHVPVAAPAHADQPVAGDPADALAALADAAAESVEAAAHARPLPVDALTVSDVGDDGVVKSAKALFVPSKDATGEEMPLHLDDLLRHANKNGASDLHLTAGMPPCIRVNGAVQPIDGLEKLDNETIRTMIFGVLPQALRERFEAEKELDTSHSIVGVGRFRLNVFQQRNTVAAVLRSIPHEIPSFDTLGIPDSVRAFAEMRRGLVLVTGPTGSGKSTTLASLVDIINRNKPLHIITVEDPIEFLHNHKRSIVNQREVGQDTMSFSEALRRVLREDPDVILVGEMRDLETISMALTAAETGHLVFGTLHTQDAPQTIDRVIDVFPTSQQEQVRTMLAGALEGVVTQQLIPSADGSGRYACCEVMMCTPAIRNLVRSNKTHQIYSLMQTGAQYGMQTMDQGLSQLVKERKVTEAIAFDRCRNEEDLRNHLSM
jgi:twitching motility protein PilT